MLVMIRKNVPNKKRCLFPHILADATQSILEIPTPNRKYPVNRAMYVNGSPNQSDSVKVFAASIGPKDVAKTETIDRITTIISRFQRGQF
jgi:hypothetical protein